MRPFAGDPTPSAYAVCVDVHCVRPSVTGMSACLHPPRTMRDPPQAILQLTVLAEDGIMIA